MYTKYLLFFLLLISSCKKDKNINFESISTLVQDLDGKVKERHQIRLLFTKCVAKAMQYEEFRAYIKEKSNSQLNLGFNEILFSLHHKDDICNGKTLSQYIQDEIDEEGISLFGESFVTDVLEKDPLIAIKIPDIFSGLEWDIENMIPIVYAKTYFAFKNNTDYNSYKGYHSSGFEEYFNVYQDLKYFCIVVKQSEDYILFDFETGLTDNGLSMFDLVPQLIRCWDEIESPLRNKSISFGKLKNYKIVSNSDINNLLFKYCENDLNYEYISNVDTCTIDCPRECLGDINSTKLYVDSISLRGDFQYKKLGFGKIFNENLNIQLEFYDFDAQMIAIYGLKYFEIIQPKIKYTVDNVKTGKGGYRIPEITYNVNFDKQYASSKILPKLIFEGWNFDSDYLACQMYIINYSDYFDEIATIGGNEIKAFVVENDGGPTLSKCDTPSRFMLGGFLKLHSRY